MKDRRAGGLTNHYSTVGNNYHFGLQAKTSRVCGVCILLRHLLVGPLNKSQLLPLLASHLK